MKKAKSGGEVTITGHGFAFARKVEFGSASAHFTVVSDTKIVTHAPKIGGAAGKHGGTVSVTVVTVDRSGTTGSFT